MTSSEKNSYDIWCDVCDTNQWSPEAQIIVLEGFIRSLGLLPDLALFAARTAVATAELIEANPPRS